MFLLLYGSSAVTPFSKGALLELLTKARRNNARMEITGLLLYKDGNFLQALEGEEKRVRALVDKITLDSRHKGMIVLYTEQTSERQFPDWSMGFYDLRSPEVREIPGFSDFMNTPLRGADFVSNPTKCQKLLLCFKKTTA